MDVIVIVMTTIIVLPAWAAPPQSQQPWQLQSLPGHRHQQRHALSALLGTALSLHSMSAIQVNHPQHTPSQEPKGGDHISESAV